MSDEDDQSPLMGDQPGPEDEGAGKINKTYLNKFKDARFKHHTEPKWHERGWAVVFLAHWVALLIMGIAYAQTVKDMKGLFIFNEVDPAAMMLRVMVFSYLFATALLIAWFEVLKFSPSNMVQNSVVFFFMIYFIATCVLIIRRDWLPVVLSMTALIIMVIYMVSMHHHMKFAEKILRLSLRSLRDTTKTIWLGYLIALINLLYGISWSYLAACAMRSAGFFDQTISAGDKAKNIVAFIFLLFSNIWTSLVFCTIVNVIAATNTCSWWLESSEEMTQARPCKAFCRAISHSFGSICLHAFALPFISFRRVGRQIYNCFKETCTSCKVALAKKNVKEEKAEKVANLEAREEIDWLMNPYATVRIGLYGERWSRASKDSAHYLNQSGYVSVLNAELTNIPIVFGSIMAAGLCAIVGCIWVDLFYSGSQIALVISLSFFVGINTSAMLSVLEGAVHATMVTFSESARDMLANQSTRFVLLYKAHREHHLSVLATLVHEGMLDDMSDLYPVLKREFPDTTRFESRLDARKEKIRVKRGDYDSEDQSDSMDDEATKLKKQKKRLLHDRHADELEEEERLKKEREFLEHGKREEEGEKKA